jgi:hypothetical protein
LSSKSYQKNIFLHKDPGLRFRYSHSDIVISSRHNTKRKREGHPHSGLWWKENGKSYSLNRLERWKIFRIDTSVLYEKYRTYIKYWRKIPLSMWNVYASIYVHWSNCYAKSTSHGWWFLQILI